jgi:hypothetical protein
VTSPLRSIPDSVSLSVTGGATPHSGERFVTYLYQALTSGAGRVTPVRPPDGASR